MRINFLIQTKIARDAGFGSAELASGNASRRMPLTVRHDPPRFRALALGLLDDASDRQPRRRSSNGMRRVVGAVVVDDDHLDTRPVDADPGASKSSV